MNKINPLLEAMNDIDDAIISESAPVEKKRARYFKPMMIAAAAAVLCGATAVTAVASIKPPQEIVLWDEPLDVDYTVYTDEKGREIRTYAFNLPDYALGEEIEGCTPVGKVRYVQGGEDDGAFMGSWFIVDEEGTRFTGGINNKEVRADIIDPASPRTHYDRGVSCANFLHREYDMIEFYECDSYEENVVPDRIYVYVYRYDDKETVRKLYEKHNRASHFDEESFDRMVERHHKLYPDS